MFVHSSACSPCLTFEPVLRRHSTDLLKSTGSDVHTGRWIKEQVLQKYWANAACTSLPMRLRIWYTGPDLNPVFLRGRRCYIRSPSSYNPDFSDRFTNIQQRSNHRDTSISCSCQCPGVSYDVFVSYNIASAL